MPESPKQFLTRRPLDLAQQLALSGKGWSKPRSLLGSNIVELKAKFGHHEISVRVHSTRDFYVYTKHAFDSAGQTVGGVRLPKSTTAEQVNAFTEQILNVARRCQHMRTKDINARLAGAVKQVPRPQDQVQENLPDFEQGGGRVTSPEGSLRDMSVEQVAPNIVIFFSEKESVVKPAGWIMLYFMDTPAAAAEMKAGKIAYPMFMPGSLSMRFSGYSMIDALWKKTKRQRWMKPEDIEADEKKKHVVGALEAYRTKEGIYVDNLSVRPGWKRNTIATKLMQALKNHWPGLAMSHSPATEQGKKFLKKTGQYQPRTSDELESQAEALVNALLEAPEIATLKKNRRSLDPGEREQAGEAPVQKAFVNGKTWYWSSTHRCYQAHRALKAAINAYWKIVEPSG